jgi:IS30 family transposase
MTHFELGLIKQGNKFGLSNRQIARQLGYHHNTVSYWLKRFGLKSSWASQKIQYVGIDKAKCSKCGKIKPLKEFQHGRRGQQYEYKFSYCIACRKKQAYLNLNKNQESFLKDKFNRLKLRAGKKRIKFNLTFNIFMRLFLIKKDYVSTRMFL